MAFLQLLEKGRKKSDEFESTIVEEIR